VWSFEQQFIVESDKPQDKELSLGRAVTQVLPGVGIEQAVFGFSGALEDNRRGGIGWTPRATAGPASLLCAVSPLVH
jgi:hypothetical protein